MKKLTTLIAILLCAATLFAQAPEKFSYQAVVRNASNALVTNAQVGVRMNILQGSVSGNAVYSESHVAITNANGLVTVNIGGGSVLHGSFVDIDWSDGPYFLKMDIDPNGGNDYSITSVQQLLSVPYALYAKDAGNGFSGDYNDLVNIPQIPQIPTDISAFNNDAGYITMDSVPAIPENVSAFTNDAGYLTDYTETDPQFTAWDKDYNDLINTPAIPVVPTNVSAFNNDAGYLISFTEQQVLTISNDTLFLTGGSFVKLPAGFSGDYNDLTNIPEIPTVPTEVSAFANDAGYITMDSVPAIPENVSAFVNDAGYITGYTETDPQFNAWDKDYNDLINTPAIPVVPTNVSAFNNDAGYLTSFTEQQVLTISNDTLFLTGGSFVKLPAGFSGDYNDLTNTPEIPSVPTEVSAFANDAGYITMDSVPAIPENVSAFVNDVGYITGYTETDPQFNAWDKDYNDLINTPAIPIIPTNVSAFNNDAGYLISFTEQQVLTISNDTLFLTGGSFVKLPAGFSGDYNDLTNTPEIPAVPTEVSAFANDAGYITMDSVPAIPENVSAFVNDANYVTISQLNAANYITNTSACADSLNLCALLDRLEMLENQLEPIMIQTEGVTAVSQHSFTVNGKVLTDGNSAINQRGFVYATIHNPTLDNNSVNNGNGIGEYTSTITGLTAGTTYYVRAFATNVNGTFYGNEVALTTTATTPSVLPSVTTIAVTNITTSEATVKGAVTFDGGENVTQRGFVYDTLPNPTMSSMVAYHGTGTGQFSNLLTSLQTGKTYYVRAFATNSVGTAYGNEISFTTNVPSPVAGDAIPCPNTPTVTDHEGNVYNTVKIGTQCWTKENLRTTTSPSTGTYLIPPAGTTHTCSGKQARWYNDDSTTYAPRNYGLLYNWLAAVDTFDVEYGEISMNGNNGFGLFISGNRRGICPEGWHVPSGGEWDQLTGYLNSHSEYQSGGVAGYVAKALTSTIDWQTNNTTYAPGNDLNANNTSGFNALPTGVYSNGGDYYHTVGTHAWFWSTSYSANGAHAHSCRIENNRPEVFVDHAYALNLCSCASVRCLRDIPCTEPIDTIDGGNTPIDTTATPVDTTTVNYGIPCPNSPTVTDIDGNTYNTVQLGNQCWMAENLRTTRYADNTVISQGSSASSTEAYWYYPNNDASNMPTYGLLYNWKAVMHNATSSSANPSGVQGICPTGWHLPSDAEWTQLADYVSSQNQYVCGNDNTQIAKALASTTGWNSSSGICDVGNTPSNNNATNFNAPPAGVRTYSFFDKGRSVNFWKSNEYNSNNAYSVGIALNVATIVNSNNSKTYGFSARCVCDESGSSTAQLPTVTTSAASNITANSATCGGNVTTDGGATVTARGVCWSTSHNPTVSNCHTTDGSGTGSFTSSLTGLTASTTYYVRAYATNGTGTAYGNEVSFTTLSSGDTSQDGQPCPGAPTVTDIDGNTYNTVQIGQQCWMKENLRTTHFANGESIDNGVHSIISYEHPYGYFNGPADNIYGFYYNGAAATDSKNICPSGWHVPSDAEWTQLTDYVGSQNGYFCLSNQNVAKSLAFTSGWNESEYSCTPGYNQSENNATGFSAFPAGRVYGGYENIGELANFWTSTKESVPTGDVYRVISRSIGFYYSDVQSSNWYDYSAYKIDGKSVRCVKD